MTQSDLNNKDDIEKLVDSNIKALLRFRKQELTEFSNYLNSPVRIFFANFLAGTARGLGFLIGAALVLTVLGFIVKEVLSNIPVVGQFFQMISSWMEQAVKQTPISN